MRQHTNTPDRLTLASLDNEQEKAGSGLAKSLKSQSDMKEMEPSYKPPRWSFPPIQDESAGGSCTHLEIVQSNEPWNKQKLDLSSVARGWYSLVFCVSLDMLDIEQLESITFDAKLGDYECIVRDTGAITIAGQEDIRHLPKSDPILLRLHRQVDLSVRSDYLYPIITIKTTVDSVEPLLFKLHYIELATSYDRLSTAVEGPVYPLYGEDKPDLFIKVADSTTHPVKICNFDVSDTGTHAVTLYLVNDMAYLDVWDIQKKDENSRTPLPITKPFARISFKPNDGNELVKADYDVAISSTGLQVAICSLHKRCKTFEPLSIYKCGAVTPADHPRGGPWQLQKEAIAEPQLASACGNIVFRTISPQSSEAKHERFFKFDGITLEVYKATGKWRQLFSLHINIDWMSKATMAGTLFYGIRGPLLAYTGTEGLVLIWNFEEGKMVSSISVPVDTSPVKASLSRDGSLVAIEVNGTIRVHEVESGVRLGSLKGLSASNPFEVDFVEDYFSTLNYAASTANHGSQPNTRSIIRVRDMAIVDTYHLHPKYWLLTPQAIGAPIFGFEHGAIVNIIKHEGHTPIEEISEHINCIMNVNIDIHQFWKTRLKFQALEGMVFELTASDVLATWSSVTVLQVAVKDAQGTTIKSAKISIGTAHSYFQVFFLKKPCQLFILSSCYLQVWNLSATGTSICELAYIWKLHTHDAEDAGDYHYRRFLTAETCEHEKRVQITLSQTQLMRHGKKLLDIDGEAKDIITVPVSSEDTLKMMTEDMRMVGGVGYLGNVYAESDSTVQESILHYLKNCMHPSDKYPEPSLVSLCRAWSSKNSTCLEKIVSKLLPLERITWIPHLTSSKGQNPLDELFLKIKQAPAVFELVEIITAYCTEHAIRTRDSSFLVPIFASMPQFMKLLPDYARDFLTKVSYLPTKQREFIVRNHIIAYPPKVFLKFWKSKKKSLAKTKDPILQLNVLPAKPNQKNNTFRRPLFIASFNMLWNYKDDITVKTAGPNDSAWWKTLYHILTLKLRLRTHIYVECHNFNLEVFDNPAIAALVAYKWNTIGFMYWSFRFTFQLIFYILVIAAALMQVFHDSIRKGLVMAVFISIIVFGVVFLWLELLQAIKHGKRYRTVYNFLDVLGFMVPVGTSIHQIIVLHESNPDGYTKTLSFAVLLVFLHALFELRVFKSVCKCVSIIQHTVAEIRAFFFIFAAGIVTFAIATLHLLRSCPVLEGCKELKIKFSGDFFGALSTTYFFMGGRYDDVDEEFDSDDWEFHLMMAVYFFFTVIIMLNVLIALINVAFTKGDDSWRLAWNESRLRYIESAENMSYQIPGFRQSYNWFPKEIFYSATLQQVRAYHKKYHSNISKDEDRDLLKKWDQVDDEEDENQGAARVRKLHASQDERQRSSAPIHCEGEESNNVMQEDQEGDDNDVENEEDEEGENGDNEEAIDVDGDEEQAEDHDEFRDNDASLVEDLKVQVVKLRSQVSQHLKGQQEMLEQLHQLRELLLDQKRV